MGENRKKEEAAIKMADEWLNLVDAGQYGESWDEAAALFQGAVTREQFEQMMVGVRTPLGATSTRSVKTKQYATELPGAPDGEYVVIQYETSFENKKNAVETVTPMMDGARGFRVSGYFIK